VQNVSEKNSVASSNAECCIIPKLDVLNKRSDRMLQGSLYNDHTRVLARVERFKVFLTFSELFDK
jgi:hypothetical protein